MKNSRKQLTLFLSQQQELIEKIREKFNSVQFNLIKAHVTLAREDEIVQLDNVLKNIRLLALKKPLQIQFNPLARFENGKGLWLPSSPENENFQALRVHILKGVDNLPRTMMPHLTLMHPRNSTCTDSIFNSVNKLKLPTVLHFEKISLIEQVNGEKWLTIDEFPIC